MLSGWQGVAAAAASSPTRVAAPVLQLRAGPCRPPLTSSRALPFLGRRLVHQCKPASASGVHVPPQQQQPRAAEPGTPWTSAIGTTAVLIVDATNRAGASAADAHAFSHVGATLPSALTAWLLFLRDLLQPSLCIAVFDAAQVRRAAQTSPGTACRSSSIVSLISCL